MKKILILGGSGLISTAIANLLLSNGEDVTVYNRGQTPGRYVGKPRTVRGDRNNFASFENDISALPRFDCVIDMICYTPEQAASAVRAFSGKVGHFIFCSSVDVYQKPAHRYPITEDEPSVGNNPYGKNKAACEELFLAVHQKGNLPVTVIRPAWSYGEGGGLVGLYGWGTQHLDRMRKGKPLIVHGDGTAIWVACHVDDLARAFVNAIANAQTFGKCYHVTGEEWLTWNQYYAVTAEALEAPEPKLVHIPTELLGAIAPNRMQLIVSNFQGNNLFDNAAAHADLNFRYTIPYLQGARRTMEWLDWNGKIDGSDLDPAEDQILAAWDRLTEAMQKELSNLEDAANNPLLAGYSTVLTRKP
jgi:nucleoside-diphosphate-sugar epimerase